MTTTRYEQTVQLIEAYIEANKLTIGDRLPTETEIARMAGVSLITVRRAMTELAQAGFIRREQGRGTFVQARRIDAETTRLGGLSDTLDAVGSLTTEVLSVARVDASPVQRSALALDLGDKVWEVRRLRRIDGEPAALEVACVPAKRAPGSTSRYSAIRPARSTGSLLNATGWKRPTRSRRSSCDDPIPRPVPFSPCRRSVSP